MSLRQPVRCKQTTVTTGVGTLTLLTAASNFQGFAAVFGAGPVKVMYALAGTSFWEVGIGTWTTAGPNTLSRDTVLASSAGGSAVSIPAGTTDVFAWAPAMFPVDVRTGSPTLTLADLFGLILYTGTGGTVTPPALANMPAGIGFPIINLGSGTLIFDPNSSETVNGVATLNIGVGQGGWFFNRDAATAQWTAIMGVTGNPAALDVAQTFTQPQTISTSGLTTLTETSTDAGATEGPIEDLFRDSASPAANDLIAAIYASGRSSTAVKRQYAKIIAQILDPTNTSEDAQYLFQTMVAGALATRMTLGQGLLMAGATGGDPGAGLINAQGLRINGSTDFGLATERAYITVSAGTPTLQSASQNITSIADTAVGRCTVTIAADHIDANWGASVVCGGAGAQAVSAQYTSKAAGSIELRAYGEGAPGALADPSSYDFIGIGP